MDKFSVYERHIGNKNHVGNVVILDIFGKLSGCGGSGSLREAINRPFDDGNNQILLNLAGVREIDSSCAAVLVASRLDLVERGGRLKIVHLRQNLRESMSLANLPTVFHIYEDESVAIDSFGLPTLELLQGLDTLLSEPNDASPPTMWGELGMSVIFRAESMRNRTRSQRSFRVKELLPSGSVMLDGISGEFVENTFEPVRYATQ